MILQFASQLQRRGVVAVEQNNHSTISGTQRQEISLCVDLSFFLLFCLSFRHSPSHPLLSLFTKCLSTCLSVSLCHSLLFLYLPSSCHSVSRYLWTIPASVSVFLQLSPPLLSSLCISLSLTLPIIYSCSLFFISLHSSLLGRCRRTEFNFSACKKHKQY